MDVARPIKEWRIGFEKISEEDWKGLYFLRVVEP